MDPARPRVMNGEIWDELCDTLRDAKRFVVGPEVPDDPRHRAEGFRYLLRFLSAGIDSCVEHSDPEQPEIGRMMDWHLRWGLDMPDCLYLRAPVRAGATYRIRGNRGTAHHFDIQVNAGHFAEGDISSWRTISSLAGQDLELGPDGGVEFVLSADEHAGNWLHLEPDAEWVQIRQYFGDWEKERNADLWMERVGAGPAPPTGTDEIESRIDRLRAWMSRGEQLWENMSRGLLAMEPNTLVVNDPGPDAHGGLPGQIYCMGNFHCGPDEAVILEFPVPRCHHWNVSLADYYWVAVDYATRQSSLNGFQAHVGADGWFRGVIAHEDPGFHNWIDTAGLARGSLAVRFLLSEGARKPALRVVPFDRVAKELPDDTPRTTPEERARTIERRKHAVRSRFRR